MTKFDYEAPAELFPSPSRKSKRTHKYRRFDTAADAIRFAVEELPAPLMNGAVLETRGGRLSQEEIRALYDSDDYPLKRPLSES